MYAVWLRVSARTPWKWCYECPWATEATFFVSSLVFDTSKLMQMICGVEGESTQENMCWKTVATWLLVIIILLLLLTLRPQVFNTIRKSDIHVQKDALAGFCSFAVLQFCEGCVNSSSSSPKTDSLSSRLFPLLYPQPGKKKQIANQSWVRRDGLWALEIWRPAFERVIQKGSSIKQAFFLRFSSSSNSPRTEPQLDISSFGVTKRCRTSHFNIFPKRHKMARREQNKANRVKLANLQLTWAKRSLPAIYNIFTEDCTSIKSAPSIHAKRVHCKFLPRCLLTLCAVKWFQPITFSAQWEKQVNRALLKGVHLNGVCGSGKCRHKKEGTFCG